MRRSGRSLGAVALVTAALTACGEQERHPGPLTVATVLEQPAELERASVRGRAFPVGATQFVLAGPERSIWVFAEPEVVRRVRRPGQAVVVTGRVERVEQDQAIELADEVAILSPARGPRAATRRPVEVLRARRNQGAPYVDLSRLETSSG